MANHKQYSFHINTKDDRELNDALQKIENRSGFIRDAVREKLARQGIVVVKKSEEIAVSTKLDAILEILKRLKGSSVVSTEEAHEEAGTKISPTLLNDLRALIGVEE